MWLRGRRVFRHGVVVVALVAVATMSLAGPGRAQQTDRQRQLANDIDTASRAGQVAREQAAQAQAEKTKLDATLSDLAAQVASAQATLTAAQAEVDRLAFATSLVLANIEKTQAKLVDAQNDAKTSAVLLYQRPDAASVVNLIGSADGSGAIVEGTHYLQQVSAKRRDDFARAARLKRVLDDERAQLQVQQEKANDARTQAEATKNQIESLYQQQQTTRAALDQAQRTFESNAAAARADQEHAEALKELEDARVREEIRGAGDGPPMGNGRFLRPVSNAPITSSFGYRTDPVTGARAFHAGLDFGASCGTPIRAGGNGTVIFAAANGGYGNATIVNHGGGLATLYGHQSAFAVSVGQTVSAGQVIGYVGSTGKSTGCHLHFEVRVNGNPVDPVGYL